MVVSVVVLWSFEACWIYAVRTAAMQVHCSCVVGLPRVERGSSAYKALALTTELQANWWVGEVTILSAATPLFHSRRFYRPLRGTLPVLVPGFEPGNDRGFKPRAYTVPPDEQSGAMGRTRTCKDWFLRPACLPFHHRGSS